MKTSKIKIKTMKMSFSKLKTRFFTPLSILSIFMLLWSACTPKVDDGIDPNPTTGTEQVVEGKITTNTTWAAKNKYLLKGFVYVEAGVTLTIEAGTIIKGDKSTKGTLIVKPTAKIIAEGTPTKPIVFTSNQPKGQRDYGDWGGVIILGKGIVNKKPIVIEGENQTEFGGTDNADNSGILKYVRIEFAGIAFEPDKEINGLTFGGVGSGTTVDYVQVSYANDDAFEWFGGAVNAKHLIAYRGLDDDFDTDNGFSGNVQFGLSLRDPNIADQCACSVANGFESDNDATGSSANPQTRANFANISIFMAEGTPNAKYNAAIQIRRNSGISIYNSLFVGGYKVGLEVKDSSNTANFRNGITELAGLTITGYTNTKYIFGKGNATDSTRLFDANRKNDFGTTIASLGLNGNFNKLGTPNFVLSANSPLLTNGVTLNKNMEQVPYRGAFGTSDWTQGWANFDPQNTDY
jgi:hypothetical protein